MAPSVDRWDAIKVLKIDYVDKCAGFAPSKGRRCHNRIADHNQGHGKRILDKLGSSDLDSRSLKNDLEDLAPVILCKRNHQNQAATMVDQWLRMIVKLKAERSQQRAESLRTSQRSSGRVPPLQLQSSAVTTSTSSRRSRPVPLVDPDHQLPTPPATPSRRVSLNNRVDQVIEAMSLSSMEIERTIARLAASARTLQPPNPTTPSTISPPEAPQLVHQDNPIIISAPTTPSLQYAETPLTITVPEPDITPLLPEGAPVTVTVPDSPLLSPVHTSSIEECSICFEPLPHHTAISSECGHSFHADCINGALDYQDSCNPRQPHSCPYCRTAWLRRKVEGDCSICQDQLLPGREDGEDEGETENAGQSEDHADSAGQGEELVWCELQCGKNYHAGCMRGWLAAVEDRGGRRSCPDCRADWVSS